jgi:hypothetical protein
MITRELAMWLDSLVRKYNYNSKQTEIPPEIVQELKLKPRDRILWRKEPDGSYTLKFVQIEKVAEAV